MDEDLLIDKFIKENEQVPNNDVMSAVDQKRQDFINLMTQSAQEVCKDIYDQSKDPESEYSKLDEEKRSDYIGKRHKQFVNMCPIPVALMLRGFFSEKAFKLYVDYKMKHRYKSHNEFIVNEIMYLRFLKVAFRNHQKDIRVINKFIEEVKEQMVKEYEQVKEAENTINEKEYSIGSSNSKEIRDYLLDNRDLIREKIRNLDISEEEEKSLREALSKPGLSDTIFEFKESKKKKEGNSGYKSIADRLAEKRYNELTAKGIDMQYRNDENLYPAQTEQSERETKKKKKKKH